MIESLPRCLVLDAMGVLFAAMVISSDAKVRKPDRGSYERLFVETGCRPAELLFVDDRPKNVAAAVALGIPATAV